MANAGCESLAVASSYLGMLGGGLSAAGVPEVLVPDGVSSVTYALADGRRLTAAATGNLLSPPSALQETIRGAHAPRTELRRILAARAPVSISENGPSGAALQILPRPAGLIDEYLRLLTLFRGGSSVRTTGDTSVLASCSARTHRCVAVVLSTACTTRHHRCTLRRRIARYRYAGSRPPRGTTGGRALPTGPVRARLNRYVVHPHALRLVLSGAPHRRVQALVSISCFSTRGASSGSGEFGPPLQVAVPSRTRLFLPARYPACDVGVLVVAARGGAIHARLARG